MANVSKICTSFKLELLCGVHCIGKPSGMTNVPAAATDTINAALYYPAANLDATTTVYVSGANIELPTVGGGYTVGGTAVTNANAPVVYGTTATWQPSAAIAWGSLTATAFDAVLLYNASKGNKAIAVFNFGSTTITASAFSLTMPPVGATTSLIQLGP